MGPATQLEASHEMITDELVATVEKATNTVESEEDTPLLRQRLQRVLGIRFMAAAIKKIVKLSRLPTVSTGTIFGTGFMSERIAYS